MQRVGFGLRNAHTFEELGSSRDADRLQRSNGRNVSGLNQSLAHCHRTLVLIVKVVQNRVGTRVDKLGIFEGLIGWPLEILDSWAVVHQRLHSRTRGTVSLNGTVKTVDDVAGLAAPQHCDDLTIVWINDGNPSLHLVALEGYRVVSGIVQVLLGAQVKIGVHL